MSEIHVLLACLLAPLSDCLLVRWFVSQFLLSSSMKWCQVMSSYCVGAVQLHFRYIVFFVVLSYLFLNLLSGPQCFPLHILIWCQGKDDGSALKEMFDEFGSLET